VKRKGGAVQAFRDSGTSTSSILKARAREAREASKSPPLVALGEAEEGVCSVYYACMSSGVTRTTASTKLK
jgi:hypothetical protein